MSSYFCVESIRDGKLKKAEFDRGDLTEEYDIVDSSVRRGTRIYFKPDETVFKNFKYRNEFIDRLLWNYAFLNRGLTINFNGEKFISQNGLKDLLNQQLSAEPLYPIIHIEAEDIEVSITHTNAYGEEYYSFVNGQHTTQGGTHQSAFREAYVKVIRDHYNKNFEAVDIRSGIVSAISIKVVEPIFESQTKTKLGSTEMGDGMPHRFAPIINDFLSNAVG